MLFEIVKQLNVSFPAVPAIKYGDTAPGNPPYAVVKQEADLAGRGTAFRIIAHFAPGQQIFLNNYIRGTVAAALDDFSATNSNGNYNTLERDYQITPELTVDNDDGTISMERVYYMPDRNY